jgi:hypothetical protein
MSRRPVGFAFAYQPNVSPTQQGGVGPFLTGTATATPLVDVMLLIVGWP